MLSPTRRFCRRASSVGQGRREPCTAMSLTLAPTVMQAATEPAIGIFWRVGNSLLIERTVLAQAEPYGDCLTHAGGHYERWTAWQALGGPSLRAAGLPPEIGPS